jgi:hypothetical protein
MGYLTSAWTFGLPLGGLYWFWKLKIKADSITDSKNITDKDTETVINE